MIYDNLSCFADFFQELKIDLYQNQPNMLIMYKPYIIGDFIVNLLWNIYATQLLQWKGIDKKPVFYLTEPPYPLFIIPID